MAYELFFDGFETYSAIGDLAKFGYVNSVTVLSSAGGRRSSKALQINASVGFSRSISASTHVVLAGAVNAAAGPGALFELRNGTTVHAALALIPNQVATLAVGGSAAVSAVTTFPLSTWMFIELGVSIGDAGVGTYEVRVNGSAVGWFPTTTADTKNGATTTIDNIQIRCPSGFNHFLFDDFYYTYGNELVWLGDSRVDRLLLTGNTATQDWTPSTGNAWERLNAGDGYVESDVDEATSFFELADLSYNPLAIHGVKVGGLIKKSDAGYREACLLTNSDGTITETSPPLVLSTDTLSIVTTLKTDPATGLAWDLPGVQALQPGLRVKV